MAVDNEEAGISVYGLSGRVQRNVATGNWVGIALNAHDSDIDANTADRQPI